MEGKLSNPAPLGLTAFGMTTVLLNLHNSGLYGLDTMILAMGIFYGGIGQVIAGIMEFRKGNTFGTTAFCSFGLFWITLVFLLVFPEMKWWAIKAFSRFNGRLSVHVGVVYGIDVYRNAESQPGPSSNFSAP